MKRLFFVFGVGVLFAFAIFAAAQDEPRQDTEGCKDSPLISRMPGSTINSCDNKEFQQAEMPVGKDKDGNVITKTFEGEYHYWDIATRQGMSEIQIFRNFETALKQAGWTLAYEDSPNTITAHKGNNWFMLESKGEFYYQTVVTVKEMQQEVTADASSIADELNKSGHIALYGIHFDTGKAVILPDSESILG